MIAATTLAAIHGISILITTISLLISMVCDVRKYILPNIASVAIILSFLLFAVSTLTLEVIFYHIITALVVFALSFFFYLKKTFGAGDVKLLSAISLWAGPQAIIPLLFIVSIAGGLLGVFIIFAAYLKRTHTQEKQQEETPLLKIKIPYGLAIGCGGLFLMYQHLSLIIS